MVEQLPSGHKTVGPIPSPTIINNDDDDNNGLLNPSLCCGAPSCLPWVWVDWREARESSRRVE